MELNDVKLFGRIVRNAELKITGNGLKIARFTIATNRAKKNEQGKYENIGHFFPLAVYGTYAEKMQPLLLKGQKVIVSGFLKQDRWVQDGKKKSTISIGVNGIQLIFDSKSEAEADVPGDPMYDEQIVPDQEISEEDAVYIEDEEQY